MLEDGVPSGNGAAHDMKITVKQVRTIDRAFRRRWSNAVEGSGAFLNRRFFQDRNNIMLAAYVGKDLAGYAWAFVLRHPDRRRPAMFLYSLEVIRPFRRKGVGKALIRKLKERARRRRCFEIFVLTEQSNRAAMALYRTTGGRREHRDDVMFVYANK